MLKNFMLHILYGDGAESPVNESKGTLFGGPSGDNVNFVRCTEGKAS